MQALSWLATLLARDHRWDGARDLLSLVVPRRGAVEATGNPFEPYRLVDSGGVIIAPVAAYLGDLQACGRSAATQRSYAMDLLRSLKDPCRAVGAVLPVVAGM